MTYGISEDYNCPRSKYGTNLEQYLKLASVENRSDVLERQLILTKRT